MSNFIFKDITDYTSGYICIKKIFLKIITLKAIMEIILLI